MFFVCAGMRAEGRRQWGLVRTSNGEFLSRLVSRLVSVSFRPADGCDVIGQPD